MLDLLIAILIALGCNVGTDINTEDELRYAVGDNYDKAVEIYDQGLYKEEDGGGILIIQDVGD